MFVIPTQISLAAVAFSFLLGSFVFLRYNPEDLTTTFADTVSVTRNSAMQQYARGSAEDLQAQSGAEKPEIPVMFKLGPRGGYIEYYPQTYDAVGKA